jgi:hypothetical protein
MKGELEQVKELIKQATDWITDLIDLMTISKTSAAWTLRPIVPKLREFVGKPLEEVMAGLQGEVSERMLFALEAYHLAKDIRGELENLLEKLWEVDRKIVGAFVDWKKIAAALPKRERLTFIAESLLVLDNNPFFQNILKEFRRGKLGWRERGASAFFDDQIVSRIEAIVEILSEATNKEEIVSIYTGEMELPAEASSETAEGGATSWLNLWGEILKILMEEFRDKKGFKEYLDDFVRRFSEALKSPNRREALKEICGEIKLLYGLLPEEKKQEYKEVFQQFLEAILCDSSLLTKFKVLSYLLN